MSKQKLNALVIFTQQFASLTRAKFPLLKSIKNLEKETIYPPLKSALQKIILQVEKGIDLDKALEVDRKTFDSIYISMVKAGMDSGNIDVTLTELSKYITKSAKIANKIRSALTYPIFLFLAMTGVIILMLVKIIPMFKEIFDKAGKDLPESTQIAISISNIIVEHSFILVSVIGGGVVFIMAFMKTRVGRSFIDSTKLRLPFLKELIKKSAISRFVRTLGVLIKADIAILDSIEIAKSSTKNAIIEEKIDEVIKLVNRGESIADSLKMVEVFPDILIQVTSSGEESGGLDELFIDLADYYDDQVDNELDSVISIINPIMTLIMGLAILFLMVAIFEPIFQMGDTIG